MSANRSLLKLLLSAFLLLVLCGPARAEDARPEPLTERAAKTQGTQSAALRRERAKRLYEQGARAYAERRNFEAIEWFRQSAELEPSALLSYNIALAYEEAGDVKNALKYFRDYLRLAPGADDVSTVQASIGRLERQLATLGVQQLTVVSEPTGATVELDGVVVGVTPFTGEFAPGMHQIVLRRAQHADNRASIELPKDRAIQVSLTLDSVAADAGGAPTVAGQKDESTGLARIEPLTWGLLGVGVGSLTAGIVFELSRASSEHDAENAATPVDAAEARGAADSKQTSSLMLLGAGGAFLVTGGVLAAIELTRADGPGGSANQNSAPRARRAALGCTPGFCGVKVSGTF